MKKTSLVLSVACAILFAAASGTRASTPIRVQVVAAAQAAATSQAQTPGHSSYTNPGGGLGQGNGHLAASRGYYHAPGSNTFALSFYSDHSYYATPRFPAGNPGMFSNPGIVSGASTLYPGAP